MARPIFKYLVLFLLNLSVALAASPTTFCKCACFSNSTIIPLDGSADSPVSTSTSNSTSFYRTCNDCNKQFCLDLNLPICEDAGDEDVFTTCFQRDSTKDEAVVFLFIFATVGLLAWAAVKPWIVSWRVRRRGYANVTEGQ